jgi:hypothetical protein
MATRAERFRATEERSAPKRPKRPVSRAPSYEVDTAPPRARGADRARAPAVPGRRPAGKPTAAGTRSLAKKAAYQLEETRAPKAPSRKSTRKSKNRQKAGTQQKARAERAVSSPARRHATRK